VWIIDWLVNQFERLYKLAVDWYDRLREYAEYTLPRLVNWVRDWIDYVVRYATGLVDQVSALMRAWVDWLISQINSASAYLITLITQVRDWLYARLVEAYQTLSSWIDQTRAWLYSQLVSTANSLIDWINSLISWIDQALGAVRAEIATRAAAVEERILSWIASVTSTLQAYVEQRLFPLVAFVDTWQSRLIAFFDDPTRFIWAVIESQVYPWAEWFLAALLWYDAEPPPRPTSRLSPLPEADAGRARYTSASPQLRVFCDPGTVLLSLIPGMVVSCAPVPDGPGWRVVVMDGHGRRLEVDHLERLMVVPGQSITAGDALGWSGALRVGRMALVRYALEENGSQVSLMERLQGGGHG